MKRIKDITILLLASLAFYLYLKLSIIESDANAFDDKISITTDLEGEKSTPPSLSEISSDKSEDISHSDLAECSPSFTDENLTIKNKKNMDMVKNEKTNIERSDEIFNFIYYNDELKDYTVEDIECDEKKCSVNLYGPEKSSTIESAGFLISKFKKSKKWKKNEIYFRKKTKEGTFIIDSYHN